MRCTWLIALGVVILAVGCPAMEPLALAQVPNRPHVETDLIRLFSDMEWPRLQDFDKVVKGAKEYEGLFKLYQKDDHLYAEIRPTSSTSRSCARSPSPAASAWAATRSTSTSSGC